MQQYTVNWIYLHPETPPGSQAADQEVYLASDVDARIAELEKALGEAIEDIQAWGLYASEYFQEKHDLAGCIAAHRKVLGL